MQARPASGQFQKANFLRVTERIGERHTAEFVKHGSAPCQTVSETRRAPQQKLSPGQLFHRSLATLATPGRPGIRVIAERLGVNPSTVQRISRHFDGASGAVAQPLLRDESHSTAAVALTLRLAAILRLDMPPQHVADLAPWNGWSRSIGTPGRSQS